MGSYFTCGVEAYLTVATWRLESHCLGGSYIDLLDDAPFRVKANVHNIIWFVALCLVLDGAQDCGQRKATISLNTISEEGQVDVMRLLFDRHADINSLNAYDKTPSQSSD